MTIRQAYVAECDECDDLFEDDFDQAWDTEREVREAFRKRGWLEADGEVLCKRCAAERAKSEGADSTEAR